jgi:excisionase family DNA binding protein
MPRQSPLSQHKSVIALFQVVLRLLVDLIAPTALAFRRGRAGAALAAFGPSGPGCMVKHSLLRLIEGNIYLNIDFLGIYMSEQLCTVQQAAERLKLHPKTVLRLLREGRLRGTRIGKSYRILDSDLNAFAGVTSEVRPKAVQARVTCVVEVENVAIDRSQRIASFLSAVLTADHARIHQVHMTTSYDPQAEKLMLVLFGTPPDASGWLHLLQAQLENIQ